MEARVRAGDVVLEDEAGHGTDGLLFVDEFGEDVDQVVVELGVLVQLRQSLLHPRPHISQKKNRSALNQHTGKEERTVLTCLCSALF